MMNHPQIQTAQQRAGGAAGTLSTQPRGLRTALGTPHIRAGRLQRATAQAVCVAAMCLTLAACDRPLDANGVSPS